MTGTAQLNEYSEQHGFEVGMSFGGWISGVIFDATGSYAAAFLNGVGWNALNIAIVVTLLLRARRRMAFA